MVIRQRFSPWLPSSEGQVLRPSSSSRQTRRLTFGSTPSSGAASPCCLGACHRRCFGCQSGQPNRQGSQAFRSARSHFAMLATRSFTGQEGDLKIKLLPAASRMSIQVLKCQGKKHRLCALQTFDNAGRLLETVPIDQKSHYTLGKDPQCDFQLQGSGIAPLHAALVHHRDDGKLYLVDLKSVEFSGWYGARQWHGIAVPLATARRRC